MKPDKLETLVHVCRDDKRRHRKLPSHRVVVSGVDVVTIRRLDDLLPSDTIELDGTRRPIAAMRDPHGDNQWCELQLAGA